MKFPVAKTMILIGCVIIALIIGIAFFINTHKKNKYTFGIITNLEGKNPISAIDSYKAVKLAWKNFSQKYPDSFSLKFLALDNSHDPEKTKLAYEKIRDKCDFIMIATYSTAFMAIYDKVVQNSGMLHLLIGATATAFSKKDDNVIRGNLDMELEQKSIADFFNKKKVKKLLVIRENEKNIKYTQPALKYFSKYFKGDIIQSCFSAINLDLSKTLRNFKENNMLEYAYILSGATVREAGIIIQNMKRLNPQIVIVNTPWNSGPFLKETLGRYTDKVIVSSNISINSKAYRDFSSEFNKKFHHEPTYPAAPAYDMAYILFEAMLECGTDDAYALKKQILKKTYAGVSGRIKFDPYGDLAGRLYFYDLKGKEQVVY
ncbi:MAG: ABC transporter substrate-binding protein [Deltaproteobacteria bacterium]|nr:ABC transporter substrate-binding protein [Deltaproteobacteria bacterium]